VVGCDDEDVELGGMGMVAVDGRTTAFLSEKDILSALFSKLDVVLFVAAACASNLAMFNWMRKGSNSEELTV
jgi:hypothetical protein